MARSAPCGMESSPGTGRPAASGYRFRRSPAGDSARDSLVERANTAGIEAIVLSPVLEDFNEDLRRLGIDALRANLRVQLAPADVARFWLEAG